MKTRGDELRAYLFAKRLDELGSGLRRTSYRDLDAAGAVAREPGVGASMLSEDIFGARNLMSALCRVGPTSPSRHVLRAALAAHVVLKQTTFVTRGSSSQIHVYRAPGLIR
jgi:hypothetical protein